MTQYTCPQCRHTFRLDEGERGRGCPRCGSKVLVVTPGLLAGAAAESVPVTSLHAVAVTSLAPPTPPFGPVDAEPERYPLAPLPPPVPKPERTKLCYRCAAVLDADEELCYRCGTRLLLDDYGPPGRRYDLEPHRGGIILTLGLLSFFVVPPVLGPLTWFLAETDLQKMIEGKMDPDGETQTRFGLQCAIVMTWVSVAALGLILVTHAPFWLMGL